MIKLSILTYTSEKESAHIKRTVRIWESNKRRLCTKLRETQQMGQVAERRFKKSMWNSTNKSMDKIKKKSVKLSHRVDQVNIILVRIIATDEAEGWKSRMSREVRIRNFE